MQAGADPRWSIQHPSTGFAVEDLYKLLHQAYNGPGHAIPSREGAETYLREEWSALGPTRPDEVLLEVLDPEATFVRLHLRPYRDRDGGRNLLLEALIRSASAPTDPDGFLRAWTLAGRLIDSGRLPWRREIYDALDGRVRPAGFPAVHHSEEYLRRALPAYRVLSRPEAEQLLLKFPPATFLGSSDL